MSRLFFIFLISGFSVSSLAEEICSRSFEDTLTPYDLHTLMRQTAYDRFKKTFPIHEGPMYADEKTAVGPMHSVDHSNWTSVEAQSKRWSFVQAYLKGSFVGDERYVALNAHPSQTLSKVVSVLEDGIVVDYLTGRGTIERRKIPERFLLKAEISSVSRRAFDRILQVENKLDFIPIEPTYKREKLKQQGYRSIFIDGVDTAYWIRNFVSKLRKSSVNPYKTHIENFVELIDQHIQFVKKGIINQGTDVKERLEFLSLLKLEAGRRVKTQRVTYHWWIYWNYRLAIAVTPLEKRQPFSEHSGWKTEKDLLKVLENTFEISFHNLSIVLYLQGIIDQFPEKILFPVPGRMGVRAVNILMDSHIWPQSLNDRAFHVDGLTMQPDLYAVNDIENSFLSKGGGLQVYDSLMTFAKGQPPAEQEKMDIVYFLQALQRVEAVEIFDLNGLSLLLLIQNMNRFLHKKNWGQFIPESISLKERNDVHRYVLSSINAFHHVVQLHEASGTEFHPDPK